MSGWFDSRLHIFLQQNPHKDPIIVLHDINTASLRTLLTFMYNGEVNVTEEFLPILLKTAEALRICGLSTGSDATKEEEVWYHFMLQISSSYVDFLPEMYGWSVLIEACLTLSIDLTLYINSPITSHRKCLQNGDQM